MRPIIKNINLNNSVSIYTRRMITLIKNAQVFSPKDEGLQHLLIAGGKIVWTGTRIPKFCDDLSVDIFDIDGKRLIPGLIDGHAHITGGGGESGYSSRVPPVNLSQFTSAGVTTVVGVLGTDDITRNTSTLVTQARGLCDEGLTAYCHCGGYHFPVVTLTGCIRSDIVHVDRIIGVGEIALSDHRSSQPTLDELLRIASDAHVAGIMTGKAGILHCHMGDGERGLDLINRALDVSELPARVFNPTHVNRNKDLFEQALELVNRGCTIDVTAFPESDDEPGLLAREAIAKYLQADLPKDKITVSSDGGGCLPVFDEHGQVTHMGVGDSKELAITLKQLLDDGLELEAVLPVFSSNVAELLRFKNKGQIAKGMDADLVVLDDKNTITSVMAMGVWHKLDNKQLIYGTFEKE